MHFFLKVNFQNLLSWVQDHTVSINFPHCILSDILKTHNLDRLFSCSKSFHLFLQTPVGWKPSILNASIRYPQVPLLTYSVPPLVPIILCSQTILDVFLVLETIQLILIHNILVHSGTDYKEKELWTWIQIWLFNLSMLLLFQIEMKRFPLHGYCE